MDVYSRLLLFVKSIQDCASVHHEFLIANLL